LTTARAAALIAIGLSQVPTDHMQSWLSFGSDFIDKFSVDILDPGNNLLSLIRKCVPQFRSRRRILSCETAVGASTPRIATPTGDIDWIKKRNLLANIFRLELPETTDIASP
jgi:hypothetical protein